MSITSVEWFPFSTHVHSCSLISDLVVLLYPVWANLFLAEILIGTTSEAVVVHVCVNPHWCLGIR